MVSQSTKEKAESIKAYIEGKYSKLSQDEKAKKDGTHIHSFVSLGKAEIGYVKGEFKSGGTGADKEGDLA